MLQDQSDYREAINTTISYGTDSRFANQDEASRRYAESMGSSLDKSNQYREEASASYQKAQSFNEAASQSRQNSTTRTYSLNDEYLAWLQGQSIQGRGVPLGEEGALEIITNQPDTNHFMIQKFSEERQVRSENYFANQSIRSGDDIKKAFAQVSAVKQPVMGEHMAAIKTEAGSQGFGDGFSVKAPTQPVVQNAETAKASVQAGLRSVGSQVEQRGQIVEQSRNDQQRLVEEKQGKNILVKPITEALDAVLVKPIAEVLGAVFGSKDKKDAS